MKLLTPMHANTKTAKNAGHGYLSAILHLAPHTISGYNVCPKASAGCASNCLNTAGRGRFQNVQDARIRKTKLFFENQDEFFKMLYADLNALVRKASRDDLKPVVRLNGTSDIPWEIYSVMRDFPNVQFYDYTKVYPRLERLLKMQSKGGLKNYHLTFSASEVNETEIAKALYLGYNVAVVFKGIVPIECFSRPVIDGDEHDLRFLDLKSRPGLIVGLSAKGDAKKDKSGFAIVSKSL